MCVRVCVYGWLVSYVDEWIGCLDGWLVMWMNGWMVGWLFGWLFSVSLRVCQIRSPSFVNLGNRLLST